MESISKRPKGLPGMNYLCPPSSSSIATVWFAFATTIRTTRSASMRPMCWKQRKTHRALRAAVDSRAHESASRTTTVRVDIPIGGFADRPPEPGSQRANLPGRAQMLGVGNIDRCSFGFSSDIQNLERALLEWAFEQESCQQGNSKPCNGGIAHEHPVVYTQRHWRRRSRPFAAHPKAPVCSATIPIHDAAVLPEILQRSGIAAAL